jgi:multiple sugar transport system ATP-binding protein
MGSEVHLNMVSGGHNVIAKVSPRCKARNGDAVNLVVDMTYAHLFDKETELAINH